MSSVGRSPATKISGLVASEQELQRGEGRSPGLVCAESLGFQGPVVDTEADPPRRFYYLVAPTNGSPHVLEERTETVLLQK